jgi:tripartite-type tricarboxylate transporter receptor subunit TctC
MKLSWKITTFAVAALAVPAFFAPPAAQAADFYKGKVITVILPNSPGGRMTRYARTYAPYIAKYAGAKDVRIVNKKGGGGVKGTNYLWSQKPDGKTIAFTSVPTLILAQLSGSKAVKFDATKFVYLGRAATEPRTLLVGKKSGIKTVDDLRNLKRPLVSASQGTDEDFYLMAILANAIGYKIKFVTGYEGMNDVGLATIKGDSDAYMVSYRSAAAGIKSGDLLPVLMIWDGRVKEHPDVPSALEIVKGKNKEAVEAVVNMMTMHRGFFGPPKMDKTAAKILREAIWKAANDPALVAEQKKQRQVHAPSHGDKEQAKILQITKASQGIKPVLKAALDSIK